MKNIKKFFYGNKGAYRMLYSLCIVLLSVITVAITSNYEKKNTKALSVNESALKSDVEVDEEFSDEEVKSALESINEPYVVPPEEQTLVSASEAGTGVSDVSFSMPVYGEISKPYSDHEPLYSKTMDDWRLHWGVDIKCELGNEVYAAQDGTVEECGYDINLGYYIKVKNAGFECTYTSLSGEMPVKKGDLVHKGQVIGYVSDSCVSEICDEPHLHFEIQKDGEYVNPADFLPAV